MMSVVTMMSAVVFFIGLLSGVVMGLIGIGSGAILVPLLMFVGMSLPQAVTILLFTQVIPQALPGLVMYIKNGHMLWKESVLVSLGSLIGVTVGAFFVTKNVIPKTWLYRGTCLMLAGITIAFWIKYWK